MSEEIERFHMAEWSEDGGFGAMDDFVYARDYDAAQSELAALREQLTLTEESNAGLSSTISADVIAYKKVCDELAALREELVLAKDTAASWKYSADGLAEEAREIDKRLTAAEQRNAELEKNAARYIWLRDKSESVHQFYLSTPIWFTGVKFNPENVDSTIDAVMAQPTESGASE